MSLNLSNSPLAGGGGSRLVYHSSGVLASYMNNKTIGVADIGNPFVIYYTVNNMAGFNAGDACCFTYLKCDDVVIYNSGSYSYAYIRQARPDLFHEYSIDPSGNRYYGYMTIPVNNSLTYSTSSTVSNGNPINYVIYAYAE